MINENPEFGSDATADWALEPAVERGKGPGLASMGEGFGRFPARLAKGSRGNLAQGLEPRRNAVDGWFGRCAKAGVGPGPGPP